MLLLQMFFSWYCCYKNFSNKSPCKKIKYPDMNSLLRLGHTEDTYLSALLLKEQLIFNRSAIAPFVLLFPQSRKSDKYHPTQFENNVILADKALWGLLSYRYSIYQPAYLDKSNIHERRTRKKTTLTEQEGQENNSRKLNSQPSSH